MAGFQLSINGRFWVSTEVKAVQTLSRLNRAHSKKHDVFVLDFMNDSDTIQKAFADYYRTTALAEETDPNKLHDLKAALDGHQVYGTSQVREELGPTKVPLRLSCRSAVLPKSVRDAIQEVYGEDESALAALEALSEADVETVAKFQGLDPERFSEAVKTARVELLARQPLTLEMLLRVFRLDGRIPRDRNGLLDRGTRLLLTDPEDRREEGTASEVPLARLVDAAEWLACLTLLGGYEAISYGDYPISGTLWTQSFEPGGAELLNEAKLRALRRTGLFEDAGPSGFRFGHRQFAEFLAGRRISTLLPHQAKALLAAPLGWRHGAAGPLREAASFAASFNSAIAEWLASSDPEVIGLSDVADEQLRRLATLGLNGRVDR